MDYNASVQFISQLAKSLGTLCNGYIGFEEWVKVSGTLYLTLDTGKSIQCVIDEKVCRHDETSATLISNSSVAQEAEPGQHLLPAKEEPAETPGQPDQPDVVEEVIWEGDFEQLEPGALGNLHDLVQAATLTGDVVAQGLTQAPAPGPSSTDKAAAAVPPAPTQQVQFVLEADAGAGVLEAVNAVVKQEPGLDVKPIMHPVVGGPGRPRTTPGQGIWKCPVCSAKFTRNASLIVHLRKHTGDMPFKCDVCCKGFYDAGSLRKHRRVHTKERPFQCEICQASFAQSANLKRHRHTHLAKKSAEKNSHICDICHEGFTRKDALKRHKQVVHELTAIPRCKACGKVFPDKLQLLVHVSKSLQCRRRKNM